MYTVQLIHYGHGLSPYRGEGSMAMSYSEAMAMLEHFDALTGVFAWIHGAGSLYALAWNHTCTARHWGLLGRVRTSHGHIIHINLHLGGVTMIKLKLKSGALFRHGSKMKLVLPHWKHDYTIDNGSIHNKEGEFIPLCRFLEMFSVDDQYNVIVFLVHNRKVQHEQR